MATLTPDIPLPIGFGDAFQPERRLPPLREELSLHPGPRAVDGAPTWTLQDPVSNRFFRIGWLEFEILCRWHLATAEAILAAVRNDTPLQAGTDDIEQLTEFLATHDLLQMRGPQAIQRLLAKTYAGRHNWLLFALKNYLFFRIPLIRPERFLNATSAYVAPLCSPPLLTVYLLCALLGIFLVHRQWDVFLNTFPYFLTLEGLALMGLTLGITKVLHEFGHAYTAKRYGCRIPSMGIAFMVLWPVLFTDASDAWKLPSRRQRLAIASAGVAVELVIASLALLAWSFLPNGPLRSVAFLLATTTWLVTLTINLNPFMRFDGYYLLADFLDIANLQDRAFSLARWELRERLFGFGDPPPEHFAPGRHRLLVAYAFATWLYRFFLFLGIAVTVYYLFFKLLGILLMAVEIIWFIALPISREVTVWYNRRHELTINRCTMRTVLCLAVLCFLLLFPWQGSVVAPALWRAEQHARVFVPIAGQVTQIAVHPGDRVAADGIIVTLQSPDLEHDIRQGEKRIATLTWAVNSQGLDPRLQERALVTRQELEAERSAQRARLAERDQLVVRSPLSGIVTDLLEPLAVGDWLSPKELLAVVITPETGLVEAFVSEADLKRVSVATEGLFHPEDVGRESFPVRVRAIDPASTRILPEPYLASLYGGKIDARQDRTGALIPEIPVYRLQLELGDEAPAPRQIVVGTVRLQGERESMIVRWSRYVFGVLVRESGF